MADDIPPNPYLGSLCGNILMSNACQEIDFYWAGQHVYGSGFCAVALAMISQPPTLTVVETTMPSGWGARYNPRTNSILIPDSGFDFGAPLSQMKIVHESTHALQDMTMPGQAPRSVDIECSAYVAGALYNILMAADPNGPYPYDPTTSQWPEYVPAHNIALSIMANPGYAMDPTTMAPLRQAILNDYQLTLNNRTTLDGV